MDTQIFGFLAGLATGLILSLVKNRFAINSEKRKQEWEAMQNAERRAWENRQSDEKRLWQETNQLKDREFRTAMEERAQRWQRDIEAQKHEWEQQKKDLDALRNSIRVKDPTGANLVNEISAWHNMPQIIRRTKSFCDVAGLDSAAMTKILMLEPMSFDINEFCSKIESNVGRRVTTADAKDILQRFGFRADHAEWVLEGPPSRDFLESIDTATIK